MAKKILIVGPDADTREQLIRGLARKELQAWALSNVQSTPSQSYLGQVDLIILDVPPSETEDWGILQRIRGLTTVPVLVLVSANDYRIKIQCLECGADQVMTKPVDERELNARVGALLRRTRTTVHKPGISWLFKAPRGPEPATSAPCPRPD